MKRRHILAGLALGAAACSAVQAQTVGRVISGYPAGGAIDQLARLFADEIGKGMAKTYIVETRAGAGGQIAAETVKAAAPDGNTVLIAAASNITIYPHTVRKPTYDAKDFAAVAIAGEYDTGLAIKPNPLVPDFKALLAQARTDPIASSYATPGAGSLPHFYGLLLTQTTGVPFRHIPYRGTGPAINDAIAGHVGSVISPVGTLVPHTKGGTLRMIATTGSKRSRQAPDVPTFRELGYPQLEASTWFGLFVPAGTPPQVIARLNEIVVKAVQNPAIRERLIALDVEPREMTPADFSARVRSEYEHWGKVVKASGFVAEGQ
jgi:tripartite-type tricarboxylate transporter receptor subunit TctC